MRVLDRTKEDHRFLGDRGDAGGSGSGLVAAFTH